MIFKNGKVFVESQFTENQVRVSGSRIVEVGENLAASEDEIVDLKGRYLIPGFVEIHSHGCVGYDFSNASAEEIEKMLAGYLKNGVTSILATTMTNEYETYKQAMRNIRTVMEKQAEDGITTARIYGINMEGPYLGEDKKGAHDPRYLLPLSNDTFNELNNLSGDAIRLIDLDPRLEGSTEFIREHSRDKTVSLAHTSCSYAQAETAIEAGASHITHLFNAMNGLHHRDPGLVGAAQDFDVYAEIICDGIHVCPSVLRLMFSAIPEKMCVISDSMSAAGLEDGEYELGGQKVYCRDGKATLKDGTIAGSTTNMHEELKNLVSYGIPLEQAVRSCTIQPAKSVKLDNSCGSIAAGKYADLIVLDDKLDIVSIYKEGQLVR